jgi:hypothetical protein
MGVVAAIDFFGQTWPTQPYQHESFNLKEGDWNLGCEGSRCLIGISTVYIYINDIRRALIIGKALILIYR